MFIRYSIFFCLFYSSLLANSKVKVTLGVGKKVIEQKIQSTSTPSQQQNSFQSFKEKTQIKLSPETTHSPPQKHKLVSEKHPELAKPDPQNRLVQRKMGADPIEEILVPFDLSSVNWLYPNVSSWPVTSKLNVSFQGSRILMDFDKVNTWPRGTDPANDKGFNSNGWIFVQKNGKWHGGSWTWLRPEKTWRDKTDVSGATIKRAPLDNFQPKTGETYYFMVSGLVRMGMSNIQERSNIVKVVWP